MSSRSKRFKAVTKVLQELLDDIRVYDDSCSFSEVNDYIDKRITTMCKKCDMYTCVDCFMKHHKSEK
jgi:hypothetical protein